MSLPNADPSLPGGVAPIFTDTDAVRGDAMRANNNLIWGNLTALAPIAINSGGIEAQILSIIATSAGVKSFIFSTACTSANGLPAATEYLINAAYDGTKIIMAAYAVTSSAVYSGSYNGAAFTAWTEIINAAGAATNSAALSGAALSTDGTLATNSNTKVPTEQAVKTYADTSKMNFDLVIDSDAKFLAWQTSGTWQKVLIKAGSWTLPTGGIDLTARGTTCVVGESGSTLVFSEIGNNGKALSYDNTPASTGYYMDGVSINVTTALGTGTGFNNCYNMTRCKAIVTISAAVGFCYGAANCANLIDCIITINATSAVDARPYGYYGCNTLVNCIGTAEATAVGAVNAYAAGFYACASLTNCTGNGTGNSSTATFGGGSGHGIQLCVRVTNCFGNGVAVQGSSYAAGIYDCNGVFNCVGWGTVNAGSGKAWGFSACTEVIACRGKGLSAGSAAGHAFSSCKHCGFNRSDGASKTGVFDTAGINYCDSATSVAVTADTAASGWNNPTNS